MGGLGITKLSVVNDAILVKWGWRYQVEIGSLWRKIVEACNESRVIYTTLPCNKYSTSAWKYIVKQCEMIRSDGRSFINLIKMNVGDGKNVQFWADLWCGEEVFWRRWPNLFKLEKSKCCVGDRVKSDGTSTRLFWDWIRPPDTIEELQELWEMLELLYSFGMEARPDRWKWEGSEETFSVRAVKTDLMKSWDRGDFRMRWINCVPYKCNILAWRAEGHRIPAKVELRRRSINIGSTDCAFCEEVPETVDHLFTGCAVALETWSRITNWCGMARFFTFDVRDLQEIWKTAAGNKKRKKVIHGIVIATIWCI